MWSFAKWACCAAIAALLVPAGAARGDPYPARPVHLIVGFAAGGGTDVLARAIAKKIGETWPHPLVVENKPGADGDGFEVIGNKPEEFAQVIERDMQKWGSLIRSLQQSPSAQDKPGGS